MQEWSICDEESLEGLNDLLAVGEESIERTESRLVFKDYSFVIEPDYQSKVAALLLRYKQYVVVETAMQVYAMLKHIEQSEYIAYDTETTGLNVRLEKVIGFSVSGSPGIGYYLPLYNWDVPSQTLLDLPFKNEALPILKTLKGKKLIMHNGSYDIRITKNNFGIDLQDDLYADTMLMLHTLDEESDFGLKDIAKRFSVQLGLDDQDAANQEQLELEQNVLANGGKWSKNNKEIFKGHFRIIGTYGCADTDITLRSFLLFDSQLHTENLYNFFYVDEVMPLYKLVTIVMEDKGVHLDMPKLQRYLDEILTDMDSCKSEVLGELYKLPEVYAYLQRYLAEEYPEKTSGNFAQGVVKYFNIDLPKNPNGKFSITKKTLTNADQTNWGVMYLQGERPLLEEEILGIRKLIHESPDFININSKSQLSAIVFDYMKLEPIGKTPKGNPQFDEDFVDYIADKHRFNWARKLKVYNKLLKLEGSSLRRFNDEQENGIFYPQFKQHGTTSGRHSSNLQQLPRPLEEGEEIDPLIKKYTDVIRELFISKTGYVFIDDDYDSLEPRVFADDAADQDLIDIFINIEDFYSKIAINAQKLKGVSASKKDPNYLKNVNPKLRQDAKAYALGIRYGLADFKLHKMLDISMEDAQKIIDNYFQSFPKLKKKMDSYLKSAKLTGKVTSKFGRVRHLHRIKEIYQTFGDDIRDFRNMKRLANKHNISFPELKQIRKEYNGLLNNALNFPIQSAAASIMSRAAIAMSKQFKEHNLDAWVSLLIHDQAIVSCNENCIDEVKRIVQDCMENTNKLLMPLIAKPEVARNLKDGH